MKTLIILSVAAIATFPSAAQAHNIMNVLQFGTNNVQSTYQQGHGSASVVQIGTDNSAHTRQTGYFNQSIIVQVGSGHSQSHVQTGRTTSVSIQSTLKNSNRISSRTVTALGWTISNHLEFSDN